MAMRRSAAVLDSDPLGSWSSEEEQRRRSILLLRWVVIIATSYLVLFSNREPLHPIIGALLIEFILSNVVLHFVRGGWILRSRILNVIVILDSFVCSAALMLTPGIEGNIVIVYFFVMLLAAVGGSFFASVVASIATSALYVAATVVAQGLAGLVRTDVLLQVPFIFCVGVFYGYLSDAARRERERADTAEISERAKTELMAMLSHDVRNSLGAISGFAELLLQGGAEVADARETLQRIQSIALESGRLISNLLDVSRIERGKLPMVCKSTSIAEVLHQVADRYTAQASLKGVSIAVEVAGDLPVVRGDALQLDRVFANLLSNAVKFTANGGRVAVRARDADGSVVVEVVDGGPGIPPRERKGIFDIYQQTEAGLKAGGTGLGLYVVRTVLDAHRATIEIDAAEPSGAVFRVTFPRSVAARTSGASAAAPIEAGSRLSAQGGS